MTEPPTAHWLKRIARAIRFHLRRLAHWLCLGQIRGWFHLRFPGADALRLHVGCGQRRLPGFINIDRNFSLATDYVGSADRLPCADRSVERIESYHVIEHIPFRHVEAVLCEWRRVLRPNGTVVIECPDFDEAVREYLAGRDDRLANIFGHHRFPGDSHCWGYNAPRLSSLLASCGFTNIEVTQAKDYHAEQEPCLRVEATAP